MNADLYATWTDMKYAKRWYVNKDDEEQYLHEINKSKRLEILDIHRLDKVHEEELLVNDPAVASLKGTLMLEDFSQIRPVIGNIKLFGLKWLDLRLYDILVIEFVFYGDGDDIPRRLIPLISLAGRGQVVNRWAEDDEVIMFDGGKTGQESNRYFLGKMRCQLMSKEFDAETGVTTISVRQRDRSAYLGAEYD
jgi:hypothetical protein